jgi:membrane-associated phospholipid phosphatase
MESLPNGRRSKVAVTVLLRATVFLGLMEVRAIFGYLRGIVDDAGFPHERAVLPAIDRALGFGMTPGQRLQSWFFAGHPTKFDSFWLGIYDAWFIVPTVLTLYIVIFRWDLIRPYATARILLYFLPIIIYLLMPTEPPWMAIHAVRIQALTTAGFPADSNPVAAFPSMHVLTPLTIALWLSWKRLDAMAWLFWVFTALTMFAVLYLGEHYLVDVLASVALAPAIVLLANSIEQKFSARSAARSTVPHPGALDPSQLAA